MCNDEQKRKVSTYSQDRLKGIGSRKSSRKKAEELGTYKGYNQERYNYKSS